MPRHISRERDTLGSAKKTSPKVEDPNVQKALDYIYRELNTLEKASSKSPIASESTPLEGDAGDIRLFTKKAKDGTTGYFIQGKFGDSWAAGRLGLQVLDPELPENSVTSVKSYVDDGGEYITKLGVTYENLAENLDVGAGSDQVARGSHAHANYDAHIADATIHFTVADILSSPSVKIAADNGTAATAARSDHVHALDTSEAYTWTNKQTITVNSGDALDITGDVTITGDLTVDFAATGDGNGDATIDGSVVLNAADSGQDYTDTHTTRINGKLTAYNETVIQHNDNQLSLRHGADASKKFDINVNQNALTTMTVSNSEGLVIEAASIRPATNLRTDLGHVTKKFRSIYAAELIVEDLVAQDVMATIGGRIMVAPTAKLIAQLTPGTVDGENPEVPDTIDVSHNIFETDDVGYLQSAPGGVAQMEAVKFTSGPTTITGGFRYDIERDLDGGGPAVGHTWEIDDAIVNFGHNLGEGFIDITATSGVYGTSGPHIAMHAREVTGSNFNIPEILRLGNLNGTWYTSNDRFGLMIGDNVNNQPSAGSDPFKGFLGTKDGIEIYNSPIKVYDGGNLIAYMGEDQRGDVTGAQFALGDNLTFSNNTTSGAKLKFEKVNGTYELTIDQGSINVTVDANDITNSMPWLDATFENNAAGFYVTGNWAGFYSGSGSTDSAFNVILGNVNNQAYFRLGNTNSGPSLEFTPSNLKLKNTDLLIQDSNDFVGVGSNLADAGPINSILIGDFQDQTIDDDGTTVTGDHGILINHMNTKDYTLLDNTGLTRRGYDYPILIYSGLHWGGPIVNSANYGKNSVDDTWAANYFESPLSVGGPYSGTDYRLFPHQTHGCKISHFWNYDYDSVPSGRKLIWTFDRKVSHQQNNTVVEEKYWKNNIDYGHGRNDVVFMHNSTLDYAGGFWTQKSGSNYDNYWHQYSENYNADWRHHFGYLQGGCRKDHVHTDKWCYHGIDIWQHEMKLVSQYYHGVSLFVSYGEIPAGTDVSNLYLIAGFNSDSSQNHIANGIYCGDFKIWETKA